MFPLPSLLFLYGEFLASKVWFSLIPPPTHPPLYPNTGFTGLYWFVYCLREFLKASLNSIVPGVWLQSPPFVRLTDIKHQKLLNIRVSPCPVRSINGRLRFNDWPLFSVPRKRWEEGSRLYLAPWPVHDCMASIVIVDVGVPPTIVNPVDSLPLHFEKCGRVVSGIGKSFFREWGLSKHIFISFKLINSQNGQILSRIPVHKGSLLP